MRRPPQSGTPSYTSSFGRRRRNDVSPAELSSCALFLLTCAVEDLSDPIEPPQYAELAAAATNYADADYLNTLASGLFDTGQPQKAPETQRQAIEFLPDESSAPAEFESRLAQYSKGDSKLAIRVVVAQGNGRQAISNRFAIFTPCRDTSIKDIRRYSTPIGQHLSVRF